MSTLLAVAFWLSAATLGYVYFAYPLLARVLAKFQGRPPKRSLGLRPSVTVIITAYNEEKNIRAKIDHVFSLNYPENLLHIIVVSDASNDETDELVRTHGSQRVELLRVEGRRGKTACQNAAAARAEAEILVFTDATTRISPDALTAVVENFGDPEVGCVAGLLTYQGKKGNLTAAGGLSYWNYEVALRSAESRFGTLIGVSGCLYAVRRNAYRTIDPSLISDFVIAMRMREQGLRTVLERTAVCFEDTLDRSGSELEMRVRVALRSISALATERRFLNPFRDPLFAWQLWSHKLLRYASPYCLLVTFGASTALASRPLYRWALLAQGAVLTAGLVGFFVHTRAARGMKLFTKPYYFLLTNLAAFIAAVRYLRGERMVTWKPVR